LGKHDEAIKFEKQAIAQLNGSSSTKAEFYERLEEYRTAAEKTKAEAPPAKDKR
jgi:hypothetical protein